MAGLTNYGSKTALDLLLPSTGGSSYIGWSVNGTTEFSGLVRTAVGATGWAAATLADPAVKALAVALTTAAATAGGAVSHFAVFDASSSGNQLVDWTPLDVTKTVAIGDQLTAAIGSLKVTQT